MLPGLVIRCALGAALLVAWNSSAWSARVLRAPGGGAVRALVIGIDKYPNLSQSSWLRGAVADANDLHDALKKAGVPEANIRLMRDPQAVRKDVVDAMNRLVNDSKSGDLVIISYSGHGMRVGPYKRWDGKNTKGYHSQIVLQGFSPTDPKNGHEVIVDAEMRAWYSRLDAKGVDVLVVMDSCYSGHMRKIERPDGMKLRVLTTPMDAKIHDSFEPIPMNEKEAGADSNDMQHVTFFAGALEDSTVPEMSGIDPARRSEVRGALSYFMARVIQGNVAADGSGGMSGDVTREQLLRFLGPNVRETTDARQLIDYGPQSDKDAVLRQAVFRFEEVDPSKPGTAVVNPLPVVVDVQGPAKKPDVKPEAYADVDPVRVAIINGPKALFSNIQKGRAPFIPSESSDADVVWDVAGGKAFSRGDLIMDRVDASVLGWVIDRTWAVREIRKLASPRIIDVTMGEKGKGYTPGEQLTLAANGVRDAYLTVVNVGSDGTVQLLFPYYGSHEPHMAEDQWSYRPKVTLPLGTDYTVVIATTAKADDLTGWLRDHNQKRDAFELAKVLEKKIAADGKTRLGTAGLFTQAAEAK
jgi:hypothetical protein